MSVIAADKGMERSILDAADGLKPKGIGKSAYKKRYKLLIDIKYKL